MRTCEEYEALISAFIDGALADEDRAELMAHMAECPACQAYFDDQIAIHDALADMEVKVEGISGKEPLQTAQVGITLHTRRHCRCYLVETDCLYNAKCLKNKRKQFYAGKILATQALRDDITEPRCSCIIGTI